MERIPKKNDDREPANAKRVAQGAGAQHSALGDIASRIHNSPHVVAQRKKLQSLFGDAAQLQEVDEEMLQGKFAPVQRVEEDEMLQGKFSTQSPAQLKEEPAAKPNHTGLPDNLKSGIESLSGMSMDNVKVHYNSSQPAQLNALAYAQGSDIHVAPGQEQHLPHEAWHVVQQAQGRVQPTMQMKDGVPVNDDRGLESEADVMGGKAGMAPASAAEATPPVVLGNAQSFPGIAQRKIQVKGGALYNAEGDLLGPMQGTQDLKDKANAAGTYLANSTADLTKRVNAQQSEILSPHRHLIGEIHTESRFTEAVAKWGWGADKMAESYQTSTDVTDELTVENKNLKKTGPFTDNPYYEVKELENLHPYIIQALSMVRFVLSNLKKSTGIMAGYAQNVVMNSNVNGNKKAFSGGESILANQRTQALQQWNDGVSLHLPSYKKACTERLKTARGLGNLSNALLHDMATAMSNKWDLLGRKIAALAMKPYSLLDSWNETYNALTTARDNLDNFITEGIDVWAAELVKMTKAEAQAISGDTTNDLAIHTGWSDAQRADNAPTAVESISPMREIFMAHNIKTLYKPGIVQIGAAHVTNLDGKITDGKYHNSYMDFVADTKK